MTEIIERYVNGSLVITRNNRFSLWFDGQVVATGRDLREATALAYVMYGANKSAWALATIVDRAV